MQNDPQRPYDVLPPLPPNIELETKAVLKKCLSATRALAELKGCGGIIPDQAILINAIPLQEAKLSSEIENIVTTQDELFRGTLDESNVTDQPTKEVLHYRKALKYGYESLASKPLSLTLIKEICSLIHDKPFNFRTQNEQVYIGNPNRGTRTYTPPAGGKIVKELMQNLEDFILKESDLDPLIRMAVCHYQFEAIHPFTDGNGRTGRILNILLLVNSGLLQIPVLYLSRYIIQNKPEYYRLLERVTEYEEWEPWIVFMLEGIEQTALWTTNRIITIRDLFDSTVEKCRTQLPTIYSKELIELIFRQPYCKIAFLVEAGIVKRQAASVYLRELERIGILESTKIGKETIYKHPALIKVLTA